jgi:uncharacterized membrane protein
MQPPASTVIVIQPNASLSVFQAWMFMAGISSVSLGVALYFTWHGFWPILPFAGLELSALGLALWVSMRRNAYREILRFEDERLILEVGLHGRGVQSRCELPRGMTRAWLEPDFSGAPRLLLACGQERIEIGRCLGESDRQQLATRLKELLRPCWQNTAPRTLSLGEQDCSNQAN